MTYLHGGPASKVLRRDKRENELLAANRSARRRGVPLITADDETNKRYAWTAGAFRC